ncbi:ABC-2 type transporter [Acidothermus cellulolyticus 11B]|uniref:ABC-2 type transporter n=1 Tax=Acidothermus cellulolyticus (strain ATCC 43068 / DSM 8971 / 11B) TaxID=351607 RepID=A0LTR9_ACIC1|nr:ABC transporter permease [Acidothermus cellulolyticus]ABK52829.1 ABC-2 type transporter [Acidothermus cellulolyticus 11B]
MTTAEFAAGTRFLRPRRDEGGTRPRFWDAVGAIFSGQVARARPAAIPIFLAATMQSAGLVVLLKGLVATNDAVTVQSVVSGSAVTVVSFVALNLLAQRFGLLKATDALDYFGALPIPPAALVMGVAAAWSALTVPGSLLVAVGGALFYGLPLAHVWVIVPAVVLAGVALAGFGAIIGLLAPSQEIATIAGQLGMALVMFFGLVPSERLPELLRVIRVIIPSTYAVDAFSEALRHRPNWMVIGVDLGVCVGVAILVLACATVAYRSAIRRR